MVSKKWPKNEEVTRRRAAVCIMIAGNPYIRAEEMAERLGVKRELINDDTSYLGFKRKKPKYFGRAYYVNEKGLKEYAVYDPEYDVWEDGYISKEEAIKAAQHLEEGAKIGEIERFMPAVDAMQVVEQIEDCAYEFCDLEEGWLDDVTYGSEILKDLQVRLQEAVNSWFADNKIGYSFFRVENEIEVEKAE